MKFWKSLLAAGTLTTLASVHASAQAFALGCTGGSQSVSRLVTDVGVANWTNRGTIFNVSGHDASNDNYYTGYTGTQIGRSFFIFNVSQLTGATTARLELTNGCQREAGTFVFRGINSPSTIPSWLTQFGATPYYDQIVAGGQYATFTTVGTFFSAPGNLWQMNLSGSAVADLNTAASSNGSFGIGGFISPDVPVNTVPEPASVVLLGLGLSCIVGLAGRRRTKRI